MTMTTRPKCAGGRTGAFCSRRASGEVHYLGQWRPYCRFHIGSYYDLPHRSYPAEPPMKRTLRASEAAAYLGIHRNTLHALGDTVPHYRFGARGDRYYPVDELDKYLARNHVG